MNIHDHEGIQAFLDAIGLSARAQDLPVYKEPRYNVAPSAHVGMINAEESPQLLTGVWGVVPPWARAASYNKPLINARAETVFEKRSFKKLISTQRAVVPANGFYEWSTENKIRQPWHFQHPERPWIAIAAIWQATPDGESQCCLLTTAANDVMKPIHHRMPVLLEADQIEGWLANDEPDAINEVLESAKETSLAARPVSVYVSNARNEGEECLADP